MSAWVCEPKHIAVLAQRLLQRFGGEPSIHTDEVVSVQDFAENLARLNLRSVAYLYRMTTAKAAKEFTGQRQGEYIAECRRLADSQEVWRERYLANRLWGLASCYLYQSCEHPDAEQDVTYKTVQQYERVLEAECKKVGWERDGWGL
jgi:urease accessory protein UreF